MVACIHATLPANSTHIFTQEFGDNSNVEGLSKEDFDALRNGRFDDDSGLELYYAGEMKICDFRSHFYPSCNG